MTIKEYKARMYEGNKYICGFCGKEVVNKPTLTLCFCKGSAGTDITDICEECLKKIKEKAGAVNGTT